MSSNSPNTQGSTPNSSGPQPSRKGSVKRARELLEAGVRPTRSSPSPSVPRPPQLRAAAHQTQWPLPASGLQPRPLNPQTRPQQDPRFWHPRGPPPARPPRPNEVPSQIPSPSIYSVRSGHDSEASLPYQSRPVRSFSHPKPPQALAIPRPRPRAKDDSCASPSSTVDLNPRISITTDDLFRQSTASSTSSIPIMPPVPSPEPPVPAVNPRTKIAGLAAPDSRISRARASSVSPIRESDELSDPRQTLGSLASSRAMPSSWGSGPAESEILGAYLDDDSDEEKVEIGEGQAENLVRNASLGKRQKPTMRTIMKSNPNSEVLVPDVPSSNPQEEWNKNAAATPTVGVAVAQAFQPSPLRRNSTSTTSAESCVDPEKPRFADIVYNSYLEKEKEAEVLPKAAPTMSDKRPGGRKPPRLDIGAVRNAEARGSLSSLSDLIKRATKLASNLDRGKTASRADLAADPDYKGFMSEPRRRGSGSLSDILTSFPRPGLVTPDNRGSWPVFFGRSNLRNVEPLNSNDEVPNEKQPPANRKCCGIPRKWFIVLCIVLFIIVVLAILLPVFLIAVPNENASKTNTCAKANPCSNGGVSVSSGSECSCVCVNGYTGSQCTTAGDSSCVTSEVDNGTISKKATMGSSLPSLFTAASDKFDISLDSVTIMALFSLANVTCKTENSLVSFGDVKSSSSSNTRRSVAHPLDLPIAEEIPSVTVIPTVTAPALAARAEATKDGILYDGSSDTSTTAKTDATATRISASTSTTTAAATTSAASIPDKVIEFSQIAVLYILEKTGSIDSAIFSESEISSYLTESDGYSNTTDPQLQLLGEFGLNFKTMTISAENGTST